MTRRALPLGLALALLTGVAVAGPALAGAPYRDGGRFTETFADDFILDLCGIETMTTLTQVWSVKEFSDGSVMVHVTRTFVPDDPRIPIEKGAGTSFYAPDGTQTVVGKPIQLFSPDGGVRLLDAGLVTFADELIVRGPHPFLDVEDLAPLYCPATP